MSPLQSAAIIAATLIGTAGFSLCVSAVAMPRVRAFRAPRLVAWTIATGALCMSAALAIWAAGAQP
jgi:hypothetical protein